MTHLIHKAKYFAGSRSSSDWISTDKVESIDYLNIVSNHGVMALAFVDLERWHPGLPNAFLVLSGLGCDAYAVTTVLKYCITQPCTTGIDDVLNRPGFLTQVKLAVSLALDEVTMLEQFDAGTVLSTSYRELPIDLSDFS